MPYKGGEVGSGSGSPWSDGDARILREMWMAGATARTVGATLGRTRNAVLGYLHRNDLNLVARVVPKVARAAKAPPPPKVKAEHTPTLEIMPEREPYTGPRVWSTRRSYECAFPVGGVGADTLSCCKPTNEVRGYCAEHRKRMYVALKPRVQVPRGV